MKYFLLEQSKKQLEVPKLMNWYKKVDERNLIPEKYALLPDVTVLFTEFAPNSFGNEIILEPFLLLPEKTSEILSAFEPNMKYKHMPLIDKKRERMETYVFPLLKSYDCLSEKSVLNQDKSVIVKGILKEESLPDAVLFLLAGVSGRKIVARQDFVECLLKRYIFGFECRELTVERG